jgi:hypothetical protein
MSVFRRLLRLGVRVVCVQVACQGIFVGHAALARDAHFEQRWRGSQHAAMRSTGFLSRTRVLSPDEVDCVEAWLDIMRFVVEPTGNLRKFSTQCTLNDALIFFDGRSEIADGFGFLSYFFEAADPVITSLRREETGGMVSLHVRLQTDARLRWLPVHYTFSSAATLDLEDFGGWTQALGTPTTTTATRGWNSDPSDERIPIQKRKRIRSVEHRWFGGPIVSRFTSTYKNAYGDMGDLLRRWHGFVLSTVVTNSEHLF